MDQENKRYGLALLFRGGGIFTLVTNVDNAAAAISTTYQYISMRLGLTDPMKRVWTMGDNYTFFRWSSLEGDLLAFWISFFVLLYFGMMLLRKADVLAEKIILHVNQREL